MITKLSFTIVGNAKDVKKRAAFWMTAMGAVMGKEIRGVTLAGLSRENRRGNLETVKKEQLKELFRSPDKKKE